MRAVLNDKLPCISPSELARAGVNRRWRLNVAAHHWWGKANVFRSTVGPQPGYGWILLSRRHVDTLDRNALHTLTFADAAGGQVKLHDLVFVRATRVVQGHKKDPDAVYVIDLADARWLAQNPTYATPVSVAYNVRIPAPGHNAAGQSVTYYRESTNNGSPWTWQLVLDDLWNRLDVPELGALSPTLPAGGTPTGNPENLQFWGVPIWQAYNQVLDMAGCVFRLDNQTTGAVGPSSLVLRGAFDAAKQVNLGLAARNRIHSSEFLEGVRAKVPQKVTVYFHKRYDTYGAEPTTGWEDDKQWAMDPLYSVEVAHELEGIDAGDVQDGSRAVIYDDMPALVKFDRITVRNAPALQIRAEEAAADYYRTLHETGFYHEFYSGLDKNLTPGSDLTGVAWGDRGAGAMTEVLYNPPQIVPVGLQGDPLWAGTMGANDVTPHRRPPDLGRSTHPLYPPPVQPIFVVRDVSLPGVPGLWLGKVLRVDTENRVSPPAPEQQEDCLLWLADGRASVAADDVVLARLNGSYEAEGRQYPLYLLGKTGGGGAFFPAIIRGNACPGFDFGWDEAEPVLPWAGNWQVKPGGRNSDSNGRAYHLNRKQLVAANTVVWMASVGTNQWVFDSAAGWTGTKLMLTDWQCVNRIPQVRREYFEWWNGELQKQPCPSQVGPCAVCP